MSPFRGLRLGPHRDAEDGADSEDLKYSKTRRPGLSVEAERDLATADGVDWGGRSAVSERMLASFSPENMPKSTVLSSSSDDDEEEGAGGAGRVRSESVLEWRPRPKSPFFGRLSGVPEDEGSNGLWFDVDRGSVWWECWCSVCFLWILEGVLSEDGGGGFGVDLEWKCGGDSMWKGLEWRFCGI